MLTKLVNATPRSLKDFARALHSSISRLAGKNDHVYTHQHKEMPTAFSQLRVESAEEYKQMGEPFRKVIKGYVRNPEKPLHSAYGIQDNTKKKYDEMVKQVGSGQPGSKKTLSFKFDSAMVGKKQREDADEMEIEVFEKGGGEAAVSVSKKRVDGELVSHRERDEFDQPEKSQSVARIVLKKTPELFKDLMAEKES